ncbi:four-helix bundle copper-binding protein [Roseimaritima sediminicola]|uniref:four-helix bundle copper-binding protein n=1 Tax=Roseimaritima sediminicola TaxID=2662066 RepID=UPI0012984B65|nr:four-helix bundle copper-binding protein [Roseimaritima sediminicola]
MATATASKQDCIRNCQECQTTLADMLTDTCLKEGGDHVAQQHVKVMLDCMASCSACIDFMSRNSDFHKHYCRACAEICKACAESCEKVGGMDKCVECCRKCEQSCTAMAA